MLRRDPTARRASERARVAESRIRDALATLRPLLHIDDPRGVELVRFEVERGTAVLRVDKSCPDCGLSAAMLLEGITAHLRLRVPEIREIQLETDET